MDDHYVTTTIFAAMFISLLIFLNATLPIYWEKQNDIIRMTATTSVQYVTNTFHAEASYNNEDVGNCGLVSPPCLSNWDTEKKTIDIRIPLKLK